MEEMKGIITFYVNYNPEKGPSAEEFFEIIRNQNGTLMTDVEKIGYKIVFVPVVGEANRIEKMDFATNLITSSIALREKENEAE